MANSTALPSVDSWSTSGMDSSSVLYLGVCLALLSSVSQIGKGLQKLGVDSLPELTLTPRTVKRYLGTRIWVLGVGLDIFGALIGLAALSMLPVSVAQPIFAHLRASSSVAWRVLVARVGADRPNFVSSGDSMFIFGI